jgi:flagellar motility protein MotE (MotC chaperone)
MKLPRYVRLLPSVVVVGASLLVLKTSGLVHEAYAAATETAAALTKDPVASNPDYAGGADDDIASASEVDVVNALGKRRKELDARGTVLTTQSNMIAAAEARVDTKIAQLKQLQAKITALLQQRDDAQKAQVAALVKTYAAMKAKDAARIFNNLPDEVLLPVAQEMKSDVLAPVLASMNPEAAQKLTVKLANRLTLPQITDAVAPPPVPVAPSPAQETAAAPAAAPAASPAAQASAAPAKPAEPEKSEKPKT